MRARSESARLLERSVGNSEACVPEIFHARATDSQSHRFLSWRAQDRLAEWTYGEAWDVILRVSAGLRSLGLERPDRVASLLPNGPDAMWAWLGVHAAGLVYVPLNRGLKGPSLQSALQRSRARVLIIDDDALPEVDPATLERFTSVFVVSPSARFSERGSSRVTPFQDLVEFPEQSWICSQPSDVATVMFTSGSTGRPKAALVVHGQITRSAAAMAACLRLTKADVFHCWAPLYHGAAQVDVTLAAAVVGAETALFPKLSISRYWHQIAESDATVTLGFPLVMNLLLDAPPVGEVAHSARVAMIAGGTAERKREFEQRFGLRVLDAYGSTEADMVLVPDLDEPQRYGSCGRVSPDFEIRVVDESDQEVSVGTVGELCVRPTGPNLMYLGYEDDSEATVQAWRNLWYHTGDRVYVDADGYVFFADRSRDRIRRGGENVSAVELEALVLAGPGVAQTVVLGVPSDLGEDEILLVVVPSADADDFAATLIEWLRASLPSFMVPGLVRIVDQLPILDMGKVDRESLRAVTADTITIRRASSGRPADPRGDDDE